MTQKTVTKVASKDNPQNKKSKVEEVVKTIKENKAKNDEKAQKKDEQKARQSNPKQQQQVAEKRATVVADKPATKDASKGKAQQTKESQDKKNNVVIKSRDDEDRSKVLKETTKKEKDSKTKTTKQQEAAKKEDNNKSVANKTAKKADPQKEKKAQAKNEKEKEKQKEKDDREKKRVENAKKTQNKTAQTNQNKKQTTAGTKVRPQTAKKSQNQKDVKPKKTKVVASKQPLVVSLFKSVLGGTWQPTPDMDLKFKLYKAKFSSGVGVANFYNSQLDYENFGSVTLKKNPLLVLSKQVVMEFFGAVPDTSQLKTGAVVFQPSTGASGKIVYTTGSVGLGTTSLTYRNSGIGITPSVGVHTYTNVSFVSVPGILQGLPLNKLGSGLKGDITVTDGNISSVNVTAGGTSYNVGDIVLANIGVSDDVSFTVSNVDDVRGILLEDVKGANNFSTSGQLTILTGAGTTIGFATGVNLVVAPEIPSQFIRTGNVFRVQQKNHAMHAKNNLVQINGVIGDLPPVELVDPPLLGKDYLGNITLSSVGILTTFEQVSVSSTNFGYIKIADELIKYTSVDQANNTINITERRCLDGFNKKTFGRTYARGAKVRKYELAGVSLMRINNLHEFNDVDSGDEDIDKPDITLDSYYIAFNRGNLGGKTVSRGSGSALGVLTFSDTKECGGENVVASKNIQFETLTPLVQTFTPPDTSISARARTITGTSAANQSQQSFIDQGFDAVELNKLNTYPNPRLISSVCNEDAYLQDFPGRRSLTLEVVMSSTDTDVSPVIDLDRVFAVTTTNRINNPYNDNDTVYLNGNKVKAIIDEDHDCQYLSKVVRLQTPATSLRVEFAGFRPPGSNFRTFYKVFRSDSASKYQRFIPFNGNGRPDRDPGTSNANTPVLKDFDDYLFTVADLPDFDAFQIRIVMTSSNQAVVPLIKDLRVLALA